MVSLYWVFRVYVPSVRISLSCVCPPCVFRSMYMPPPRACLLHVYDPSYVHEATICTKFGPYKIGLDRKPPNMFGFHPLIRRCNSQLRPIHDKRLKAIN